MEALKETLANHPVFKDLSPKHIDFVTGCASERSFKADTFIFKTGEPAEEFYLMNAGKVGLEVYAPPKGPLNILTLSEGEMLGWSWLFEPFTWHFDARTIKDTEVYAFDAIEMREAFEKDHEFGYVFTKCFGHIMMQRLAATRLQLLDVFGKDVGYPNLID